MDYNIVISLSVAVIALAALGVSMWQGYIAREHNKLSVKPHLVINRTVFDEMLIKYTLRNNGLGPAIIESYEIFVDGKKCEGECEEKIKSILKNLNIKRIQHRSFTPSNNQAISINEKLILLEFEKQGLSESNKERLKSSKNSIEFQIKYKSIYGDNFTFQGNR